MVKKFTDPMTISKAITLFQQARESFLQRRFQEAHERIAAYRAAVDYKQFARQDRRADKPVQASVVVVTHGDTYEGGQGLEGCLNALTAQTDPNFEIIVVDNEGRGVPPKPLADLPLLWIGVPMNLLPSEGRNVGASFARGDCLIFLDDDALAPPEYVASVRAALEQPKVMAVRGRIVARTASAGAVPPHYDLGPHPRPANLSVEGNMAILRQTFEAVAGFDPLLYGHEGLELTHRCLERFPKQKILYWPDLVIRHDYAAGTRLEGKKARQELAMDYFRAVCPDVLRLLRPKQPVPEPSETKNNPSQSVQVEPNMNKTGISIILRHQGTPAAVTALLDSLLRYNTHKPLEVIIVTDRPREMRQALQPYIVQVFNRVLPPSYMSAERPLSLLVSRARFGVLLFLDAGGKFGGDVLPGLVQGLGKEGRLVFQDEKSPFGAPAVLVTKDVLSALDNMPADMRTAELASRMGANAAQPVVQQSGPAKNKPAPKPAPPVAKTQRVATQTQAQPAKTAQPAKAIPVQQSLKPDQAELNPQIQEMEKQIGLLEAKIIQADTNVIDLEKQYLPLPDNTPEKQALKDQLEDQVLASCRLLVELKDAQDNLQELRIRSICGH